MAETDFQDAASGRQELFPKPKNIVAEEFESSLKDPQIQEIIDQHEAGGKSMQTDHMQPDAMDSKL